MNRILVVDDEQETLQFYLNALRRKNYDAHGATSAEAALDALGKEAFNLVLTDVQMQNMNGIELLKKIEAQYPQLPVVIMTGHVSLESTIQAVKHGAADYLVKPFDLEELFTIVARCLDRGVPAAQDPVLAKRVFEEAVPPPQKTITLSVEEPLPAPRKRNSTMFVYLSLAGLFGIILLLVIPALIPREPPAAITSFENSWAPAELTLQDDWNFARNSSSMTVIAGLVRNNSNRKYSYVAVDFSLYDKDDVLVGHTLAHVTNLEPQGHWQFEAPITNTSAKGAKFNKFVAY